MTLDAVSERIRRFHQVLVEQIRRTRPEYLEGQFTVAEVYQQLVPYGVHRDSLGLEMNGDYEDVLLRLLAGEGQYLVLESEHARERLRSELESADPDTAIFREFAAVDVRLNQALTPPEEDSEVASSAIDGPEVTGPPAKEATVPEDDSTSGDDAGEAAVAPDAPEPATPESGAEGDGPSTCSWCREELPDRPKLNFCPFCGTDVRVVPCPNCGEALEPRWLFCIGCGSGVSEG